MISSTKLLVRSSLATLSVHDAKMPIESFPLHPLPAQTPYPVIGIAKSLTGNHSMDIVLREGRIRMHNTLLPEDVKQRVAEGDTDWDGYQLRFF